ncbi:MAG: hypothetical protein HFF09_01220 [Oscillospiraceae bacterium]|nr:hypothetical protein [Oscillospiraceae bacterium]
MWYLQVDTLLWILASTLLYAALAAVVGRLRPGQRLTPLLLAFDLALLIYVSPQLAAFYVVYTVATWLLLRILGAVKGKSVRKGLFVVFCVLCASPFLYARAALLLPALPAVFTLVGMAYNMLKAIDGVFYVYYADKRIPLIAYANFILYFPVMTAGPILRYRDFEKYYLHPKAVTAEAATEGVKRFIRGLFKKMVLAALLGMVLERLTAARACLLVSLATLACSYLLLYFDLSGYSDLAIAVGSFTGFVLPENFKQPWTAASFTQFWRKWHVTLSDWIREHIFVVVNGKRLNRWLGALIGVCTMVVMSLWHEFSVATVVDGLFMGAFLAIENIFSLTTVDKRKTPKPVYFLRCAAVTFFFAVNTLFFSVGAEQIGVVLKGLFRL